MGRRSLPPLAVLLAGSVAAHGAACVAALGVATLGALALVPPARAQRVVPKLQGMCPLGYVDTFNGKCSTFGLMTYTVAPTRGKACPEGWMNVGGGYCRRK